VNGIHRLNLRRPLSYNELTHKVILAAS
jgi:hypothetical protein